MFLCFVISVSFLIFSYSKFYSFSHLSSFLFSRPSYNTMKITENSVLSLISKFYINLYFFLKHNFSQKWNRTQFRVVHDMIYCPCEGYVNVCSICYFLVPQNFFANILNENCGFIYHKSLHCKLKIIIFCCWFHLISSVIALP